MSRTNADRRPRVSAPRARARRVVLARWPVGVRDRRRREVERALAGEVRRRASSCPFAPETPASGIGDTGFYRSCWYRRTVAVPAPWSRRAAAAALRRGRLRRDGLGQRASCRVPRGRLHAVHGRHHGLRARRRARHDRRARRGRSARPRQAARQAGLAARAALHLVSAHHRHLADGLARDGARDLDRQHALDAEPRALGDRRRGRGARDVRRDGLRLNVKLQRGRLACSADDTYPVVAGEVHRRIALSDPGIDDFRNELLWSPSDADADRRRARAAGADAASCIDDGAQLHRPALDRASRATASCSTAGPTTCAWCSTRATGRRPG